MQRAGELQCHMFLCLHCSNELCGSQSQSPLAAPLPMLMTIAAGRCQAPTGGRTPAGLCARGSPGGGG